MRSTIRQPGPTAAPTTLEKPTRSSLAYYALVFFSLMYFVRPEDFIPGLDIIPFGKIAGGTALLALIFVVPSSRRNKVPIELKAPPAAFGADDFVYSFRLLALGSTGHGC